MRLSNLKKLLLSLLIVCLFSTSTGILPGSAQKITLEVIGWDWSPEVHETLERGILEFEKSHPGIEIRLIRVLRPEIYRQNYRQKLAYYLGVGAAPDVLRISDDMVAPFARGGYIIKLDSFVTQWPELVGGISDEVRDRFRYEGHLYGIPLGAEGEFARNAYAISASAKSDSAVELILLLLNQITTVVIVRHAETEYDGLTPLGEKRAKTLARILQDSGVSAVFSTPTPRAKETVDNLGIPIQEYGYSGPGIQDLASLIKEQYIGKTVLVAGHSNTIPQTIEALGPISAPPIDPQEHNDLFIVVICHNGRASLTHLKYEIDHNIYEEEDP